jgi:hypothetical protein
MLRPLPIFASSQPRRGDVVQTPGGGVGRYVGATDAGLEYIAYIGEDFAAVCRAFDERAQAAQARKTTRRAA